MAKIKVEDILLLDPRLHLDVSTLEVCLVVPLPLKQSSINPKSLTFLTS
jgi:hypothetical protein